MKKYIKRHGQKLGLHRETVRRLGTTELPRARGGGDVYSNGGAACWTEATFNGAVCEPTASCEDC